MSSNVKVKLFSASRENDAFLRFLDRSPKLQGEKDDKKLELFIQEWLDSVENIEIIKVSGPIWAENHLFCYLWYTEK